MAQLLWEFLVWHDVLYYRAQSMVFSKKNAGKWVASKGDKVIATSKKLSTLVKKVDGRRDKASIRYDLVPPHQHFAGHCGVCVR